VRILLLVAVPTLVPKQDWRAFGVEGKRFAADIVQTAYRSGVRGACRVRTQLNTRESTSPQQWFLRVSDPPATNGPVLGRPIHGYGLNMYIGKLSTEFGIRSQLFCALDPVG
jgi:hypothetical protein